MKKLNLYYFGETGAYDKFNPHYVCSKHKATEVLAAIAEERPFSIGDRELMDKCSMEKDEFNEVIDSLLKINTIEAQGSGYRITFPVFLEKDIHILKEALGSIGKAVGDKIISLKNEIYESLKGLTSYNKFSKERLLYHIICDSIFDGTSFEFFEKKGVFAVSKKQPGERDYITIGYEDSEKIDEFSNNLLCSSNNYRSKNYVFNSFGDSNGSRRDMYRYFRLVEQGIDRGTPFKDLNISYINIVNEYNKNLIEDCGEIIDKVLLNEIDYNNLQETDKNAINFLKDMNYLRVKEQGKIECIVPVFKPCDDEVVNLLSDKILNNILEVVLQVFSSFEKNEDGLTAIRHGVNIKEIGNELWHQIFGATNEYLVAAGFVEKPVHIEGEGRYLKSIYCSC